MDGGMKDNKLLTPEVFVHANLPVIKKVFPGLVREDTNAHVLLMSAIEKPSLITNLENRVWKIMGNDPALQRLGRERYNALPQEQKLKLLEDCIHLLDAAQEADTFLKTKL